MHSNIWGTLYLTLTPAAIIFLIAIVLLLTKRRFAKQFFILGLGLLLFPIIFITGHFASRSSEMEKRAGTYAVIAQDTLHGHCSGTRFDDLQLTLHKNGAFAFNYKPCFTGKIKGSWEWTDNMVHSYSRFEKLNDSLELTIPSEFDADTVILTDYKKRYLTFAKVK